MTHGLGCTVFVLHEVREWEDCECNEAPKYRRRTLREWLKSLFMDSFTRHRTRPTVALPPCLKCDNKRSWRALEEVEIWRRVVEKVTIYPDGDVLYYLTWPGSESVWATHKDVYICQEYAENAARLLFPSGGANA